MSEIKCEVVRDLMPLVADEVASEASRELVNGHIEGCEVCRAYYEGMTAQLARTAESEDKSAFVAFSHRMEKRVRLKKVLTALVAAIIALCVVVVGGAVVYDRMHVYDVMPIEQTQAWLWRDAGGEVNLLGQMKDGYGWYNNLGVYREGDILYLVPYEPQLKLWNKGFGGWYEEFQLDLIWENGQLYYSIMFGNEIYNAETDSFDVVDEQIKIPMKLVRWGFYNNYTTIYESGDVIPTHEELEARLDGLGTDDVSEILESAGVTPSPEPVADDVELEG